MAIPVVTAPLRHSLPANVCTGLRRKLGLAAISSVAFVLLFTVGAVVGVVIIHSVGSLGVLLAIAYFAGVVLSLGVLSAARRGQRAVAPDGIAVSAGRRAQSAANSYTRLSRTAAALALVAGIVVALSRGDVSLVFMGVLCALPLLSLASVARGVARRLRPNLP